MTKEQKLRKELDELGDWRATFPGRTPERVCLEWGRAQREREDYGLRLSRAENLLKEWLGICVYGDVKIGELKNRTMDHFK